MMFEEFEDFVLGSGGDGFWGRRCINCGAIVDPVIAVHLRLMSVAGSSDSPGIDNRVRTLRPCARISGGLVAP